MKNIQIVTQSS